MVVNVTLNPPLGAGLGNTFEVYSDVGTYVYPFTDTQLFAGVNVFVDNAATTIYVKPTTGECTNILGLLIT